MQSSFDLFIIWLITSIALSISGFSSNDKKWFAVSKGKILFVLSEGKKSFAVFKGLKSWCAWSPWYHGFGMTTQGWSSNGFIGAYEKKRVKFGFGKIGVRRNLTDLISLFFRIKRIERIMIQCLEILLDWFSKEMASEDLFKKIR